MKYIFLIFSSLFLFACSSNTFKQNVELELPTRLIVDSETKEPYSGIISTPSGTKTSFYGGVKNGLRHGICFWIKSNGDTIQLQKFKEGEMYYSNQFKGNGKRSTQFDWKMSKPQKSKFDTIIIDSVFNCFINGDLNSFNNLIQSENSFIKYADLAFKAKQNIITKHGIIKSINLNDFSKTLYKHRPENYLEFKGNVNCQNSNLTMGFRVLELDSISTSLEVWEIITPPTATKIYQELKVWAFLNI